MKNLNYLMDHILYQVLLNCAPTSTQLHPPPISSTQIHPPPRSSFNLHPAHFSLYIALSTSLELKYRTIARNWAISPNIAEKNGVLEVLIPNPNFFWIQRFLKFQPQNSFLDKFGPKKWKLAVLHENCHM